VGLIAPHDPDLTEREILLAKEAGFNLIRVHIRPSVPGYFDLTDRHGMLVYAESSLCWILDTPRLLDHGRREITEMIERDRNHPSVVFWGIFNEHRAPASRYADPLIRTARALDPTRVIVDNSGGTLAMDQDYGWADRATAVPNRETGRVPFHDVHLYIGAPVTRAACDWLRTVGAKPAVDIAALGFGSPAIFDEWYRELRSDPGQILVSELGVGGMSDLDDTVAGFEGRLDRLDAREFVAFRDSLHEGFAARGLDRCFASTRDLVRAAQAQQAAGNRRQIEAVMTNRRTSGYILTQLNDVGSEFHAGVVDLWRRPKATFHDLKRLNRDRCLVLFGARAVATLGEKLDVTLTVIDRAPSAGGERIALTVCDPVGNVIATDEREIPAGQGIKELGVIAVETGSLAGEYRVVARVAGDADELMTTAETLLALPKVDPDQGPAGVAWLGTRPDAALSRAADVDPAVLVAAEPASLTAADWRSLFDAVESGATGVVGPLRPGDAAAIGTLAERGLGIALHFGIGNWMGCYHWQPASDLFAGLPAGGLAGEAYADVLPRYILSELGGEVLAGSFRNTETRHDVAKMLWFSDVEAVAHGRGRLMFCQYRVFTEPGRDSLADRLRLNLLQLGVSIGGRG
ncbi:MAG: glycoside hydrolase family 2 TIM barrel-domain containing protein, partial [Thermomicrobiales bacterium]